MYACVFSYIHVCTCKNACIYIYICTCTYIYACVYVNRKKIYIHRWCVYIYIYRYTYMYFAIIACVWRPAKPRTGPMFVCTADHISVWHPILPYSSMGIANYFLGITSIYILYLLSSLVVFMGFSSQRIAEMIHSCLVCVCVHVPVLYEEKIIWS